MFGRGSAAFPWFCRGRGCGGCDDDDNRLLLLFVEAQRIMAILERPAPADLSRGAAAPRRGPTRDDWGHVLQVRADLAPRAREHGRVDHPLPLPPASPPLNPGRRALGAAGDAGEAMLEQQYEMDSAPQYEQRQDGDGGAAALPDFETLDDELRHSTRVVCRMVREAPAIVERLHEFGGADAAAVSEAMEKFLATFAELKSQTFAKLSTSVEEEKSKEDWFLEISARRPQTLEAPPRPPRSAASPATSAPAAATRARVLTRRSRDPRRRARRGLADAAPAAKEIKSEKAERERQCRRGTRRSRSCVRSSGDQDGHDQRDQGARERHQGAGGGRQDLVPEPRGD